jgi:ATP-binding cassette subfamily B protein
MDCGLSCLRMIAKHYGRSYTLQNLREGNFITREGVSMLGISDAAESIGMHTQGVRITLEQLIEDAPLPCILHWNQNHFVVLYRCKVHGSRFTVKRRAPRTVHRQPKFHIADPAGQKYVMNREKFCFYIENFWNADDSNYMDKRRFLLSTALIFVKYLYENNKSEFVIILIIKNIT